jgi:hypothetical protein
MSDFGDQAKLRGTLEETKKFVAEHNKLVAGSHKLEVERRKLEAEARNNGPTSTVAKTRGVVAID